MTQHRSLRLAAVVAAAVAVGLLAGCSPQQAGAAATVGGDRISETEVNTAAVDAKAAADRVPPGQGQPVDETVLLRQNTSRLVASQLIALAAAEEGVSVTQSEVDKLLRDAMSGTDSLHFEGQLAVQAGVPPSAIESFARDYLLRVKLGQKLVPGTDTDAQASAVNARLAQEATQVGVQISPRYGVWDPTQMMVVGPVNDLSVTASPSPTATQP